MKKYILLVCIHLMVLNLFSQEMREANILINLNQKQEKISPFIYGQFIEFLGRCIDGGLYEENSPLSNEQGFRTDVLQKVQALKPPILRFPGGTVVKIYHWKDGIGAKENRPRRKNLIWGGIMDNHFGTAEFVEYCHEIGAEPFLVINMSTDSPNDASDWVEYCNGSEDTYWANLRRSHGYEAPFNVKYWGIGNEEYAEPDAGKHQDVNKYIEDSWQFLKLMKLQDPSIQITLVGTPDDLDWSRKVISQMHPVCDFLSLHFYSIPNDSTYSTLLKSVDQFDAKLDSIRAILNTVPARVVNFPPWYRFPPRQEPLKVAIDEWGIWDINSDKGSGPYNLTYPYNWSHALAVGKFLNLFQRNADIVGMATWAQTVNILAPIMTTPKGSFCQTVYTPLQAYRQYSQPNHLPLEVDSPERSDHLKWIDAAATVSDDKTQIVISVLNLSEGKALEAHLQFSHPSNMADWQLTKQVTYSAPSLDAVNTMDKNLVKESIINKKINFKKELKLILPSASINFLIINK